jgi:hypothetical protein
MKPKGGATASSSSSSSGSGGGKGLSPAEQEAVDWVAAVTGTRIVSVEEDLKSGVALCEVINKIRANMIPKINRFK